MPLPRPASPSALWTDLRAFTRQRGRHQWIAAFFAVVMPIVIVVGFYFDAQTNIAPGEQIIYAESWSSKRSDAEIKVAQERRQQEQDAAAAERQRQFKELEEKFGL
jgi:hypothetical protein